MHRRTPSWLLSTWPQPARCSPCLSCVCRKAFCNLAKPLRQCLKLLQACKARYTRASCSCNLAKPSRTTASCPCSSAKPSRTRASCSCSLAKPSRTTAGRFCNSAKPVTPPRVRASSVQVRSPCSTATTAPPIPPASGIPPHVPRVRAAEPPPAAPSPAVPARGSVL